MNVLVVDDDPVVAASCRKVLEPEGIRVRCAMSAGEALVAVREGAFDLMLVDVKMPEKDGFIFLREARASVPLAPVVVMSGFSTQETVAMSAEAGACLFLPKPFTPDELMHAVRRATGASKGG